MRLQGANINIESSYDYTNADGGHQLVINGRRCTCNDRRRWTCCRCFVWLIPTLAVLTVSCFMQTFGLQEQAVHVLVLNIIIYIYLFVLKRFG